MMPREADSGAARPDWLSRLTPEAWIQQALTELGRAEARLAAHDRSAGVLGLRRAAGMALNGALSINWRPWGRTYVEHLRAIADDASVPDAVRAAARVLNDAQVDQQPGVVRLTPPSESARWLEAAKTVMAHAYAVVHGSVGRKS
jgi:HEPN domain-containing protein